MVPSKFSIDAGYAEYFDINIDWTVSNSNDVGLWADMGVKLVHRRGARTPFLSTAYDEVWAMYIPGEGMVVDFSQNRFPPELKTQTGDVTRGIFGLLMGSWGGETRYNRPDTSHQVHHNVYSSFSGRPILVPPNSSVPFETTPTIPGPNASAGMQDFWSDYGSPDFDLEVSMIEVAWYFPGEPTQYDTGQIIATQRINDALELRTGNIAQTEWMKRQEWDLDIGI